MSVLIGTDGSPDAEIAAATVSRLFGPQLGRVTVATVVGHTLRSRATTDRRRMAVANLNARILAWWAMCAMAL